ncbi:MAG: glycosyltransferase family 2 protein [Clostridia bacterium]|nr:glycosyltransferase family 2 protein [Clostridia bacterium]
MAKEVRTEEGMPLISIIIPVYNTRAYLERCLASVVGQDEPRWEALLIDDGSTDGSGKICEAWVRKDPRFRAFHKENGGLSDARNFGLDRCVGEYIVFVDSDDFLEPDCLSYLYGLIRRDPGCRVSQANFRILRGDRAENNAPEEEDAVFSAHDAAEAVLYHDRVDVAAWGKLYARSVFEGLRFPKGRLYEDTYIFAEVLGRTETYVYGHLPKYNYIKNPDSITTRSFREKNMEYMESVRRMTGILRERYPDLEDGCVRRMNHARLSVLRYMKGCGKQYFPLREQLRREVLAEAGQFVWLARTPRRDRMAVSLLRLGWGPFYFGWDLYTRLRNG